MIVRPTTAQILRDCSRRLLEDVLPNVEPGSAQVQLFMLEGVLRNMAVRASHEIAWMHEEIDEALTYARSVVLLSDDPALRRAIANAASPPKTLHLDDVVEGYDRASEALSRAIEVAIAGDLFAAAEHGLGLLEGRLARERKVMDGWGEVVGR